MPVLRENGKLWNRKNTPKIKKTSGFLVCPRLNSSFKTNLEFTFKLKLFKKILQKVLIFK